VTLPGVTLSGIDPPGVLPGARLWLRGSQVPTAPSPEATVSIGGAPARVLFSAADRLAVEVPPVDEAGPVAVRAAWSPGTTLFVHYGAHLATGLHLVDSPVVDRAGRVYCAISGPRGQETPVSVYRIGEDGGREPVADGIVNATSLAIAADGVVYVSSRFDGAVYRILDDGRKETWASELGVACGLAFAPDGSLFVGDRTGTIHRLSPDGARTENFASLPPSVAAYHLAMGPDEYLYVTGPTLATRDAVYRFAASGRRETIDATFGRPQGLAFDERGILHVVEALAGVSALYRLPEGSARRAVVAGPGLVGVAFAPSGALVVATASTLYRFAAIP
jgi:sugar lactone lactonase YvrE